ncbi:alpha/beta fold hydrolase [Planctobacterium marinum]|uniref:Alpha/beta hydrolase n=1 Tax=Planctobacterium marinum TaxID=1631968 RepID=A0AA48KTA2_9ALTE|nr:alpha/beta hydrolase [Planctobacterium marinum]
MGKKLYLIPGTMCNQKLWDRVVPYLHSSIELGYLAIPRGKNFDELAAYYHQILSDDRVNLIGFSLGGYIATWFAMLYPERIAKLFVTSNSPCSLSTEELNLRRDTLKYVESHGYKGMSRKKAANMLDEANKTEGLIDLILEMDSDLGEAEFISQYRYTSDRVDLASAFKQFPFNTIIYYSENDRLVNSEWLKGLANVNTKLSVIATSGYGHMLPLEKPRELANHINTWMHLD